ncbi:MAG TPA: helix-hairpin-helix domain-containing protein [Steroidobacteraceae bacterium]|nr:helix-hairpin-helix domain-containing protein [Steroidobacteraceae bacterium]
MSTALNLQVADKLEEAAQVLEQQRANPFRVTAYRNAAGTLRDLDRDVIEVMEHEGREGLEALPGIGKGIAAAIWEIVRTGRWSQLERMRGALEPELLLQTVPGIGPDLAHRIHDTLHVETLEGLEVAAHDGRLEQVPGFGPRRIAGLRATLAQMLGRARPRARNEPLIAPSVDLLLALDREYREAAAAGRLPTIAPKRFNPSGEAWLPTMHVERDGWHFNVLFSNTARAHELGRTHDWVVIYYYDDHQREAQCTVCTETRGPLAGQRVVRGRERECERCCVETRL